MGGSALGGDAPAAQFIRWDELARGLAPARLTEGGAVLQVAVVHLAGLAVAVVEATTVVVGEVFVEVAKSGARREKYTQCVHN